VSKKKHRDSAPPEPPAVRLRSPRGWLSLLAGLWIGVGCFYAWKRTETEPFDIFFKTLGSLSASFSYADEIAATVLLSLLGGAAALGTGRGLLNLFRFERRSTWETFALAGGLGVGSFSYAFFALGAAGALKAPWMEIVFGSLAVFAVIYNRDLFRAGAIKESFRRSFPRRGTPYKWCLVFIVLNLAVALLNALGPEIFYDSLVYHLALPQLHLLEGRLVPTPHNLFEGIPMGIQFFYGAGLYLGGAGVAKLFSWGLSVLCVAAFLALTDPEKPRTGWLAALLFISMPLVFMKTGITGTDIGTSLFTLLALICAGRSADGGKDAMRWAAMSGAMAGLAMGSKYTVWFLLPVLAAALFVFSSPAPLPRWKPAGGLIVTALIVLSPWIAKNLLFYGNPIFPLYHSVITDTPVDVVDWKRAEADAWGHDFDRIFASGAAFLNWLTNFWRKTLDPMKNADASFTGPLFGLFILVLPLFRWTRPRDRLVLSVFAGLFIFWQATTSMPRHLMPGLAVLAFLTALILAESDLPGWLRGLALASVFVSCGLQFVWSWNYYYQNENWKVVLGQVPINDYLDQAHATYPLPSHRAMRFVNEIAPPEARVLLVGDTRGFYLRRPFIASSPYNRSPLSLWAENSETADDLAARFREHGITHILVNAAESFRIKDYDTLKISEEGLRRLRAFWGRFAEQIYISRREPPDYHDLRVFRVRALDEAPQDGGDAPLPFFVRLKGNPA
jgi:hypothetical protein